MRNNNPQPAPAYKESITDLKKLYERALHNPGTDENFRCALKMACLQLGINNELCDARVDAQNYFFF